MMRMHADVRDFLNDPHILKTCLHMIHAHQQKRAGIPPTLELLGQSIWRRLVRGAAGSRAARATGSGAALEPGRKRPAAAKTAAEAAAEAQKSGEGKGGQGKPR